MVFKLIFHIEWIYHPTIAVSFPGEHVQRARALKPDLIYSWLIQSAVFGLLFKIPTVFEIHIQPTGTLGPAWHRAFAWIRGRKRIASITQALVDLLDDSYNIRFNADEVVMTPNGVDLERFDCASFHARTCPPKIGLSQQPRQ